MLELFAVDGSFTADSAAAVAELTQETLLRSINDVEISPLFKYQRNFSDYLGGIERDGNGRILSAKATYMRWFGRSNVTEIRMILEDKLDSEGKNNCNNGSRQKWARGDWH